MTRPGERRIGNVQVKAFTGMRDYTLEFISGMEPQRQAGDVPLIEDTVLGMPRCGRLSSVGAGAASTARNDVPQGA